LFCSSFNYKVLLFFLFDGGVHKKKMDNLIILSNCGGAGSKIEGTGSNYYKHFTHFHKTL